jgi:hypothetical protein
MNRPLLLAVVGVTLLKLAVLFWLGLATGRSVGQIALGHDGAEYALYGQLIHHGQWDLVPVEIRRHHPGLPMLLSLFVPSESKPYAGPLTAEAVVGFLESPIASRLAVTAVVLGWIGWVVGVLMLVRLVDCDFAGRYVLLALGAYPAVLYYSNFALTEGLFFGSLAGGILLWCGSWARWARLPDVSPLLLGQVGVGLCLACALVLRGVGLVAAMGLSGAALGLVWMVRSRPDFSVKPRPGVLVPLVVGLVPGAMAAVGYVLLQRWLGSLIIDGQATPLGSVRPVWGLPPFSGLEGLGQLGWSRRIYLIGCVLAVAGGLGWIGWQVCRARLHATEGIPSLPWVATLAVGLPVILFHLSLSSLDYYGKTIPLANYQDRYLAPIWPLVLLGLPLGRLPWWLVGLSLAGTVALSVYWGVGYFRALDANGHPLLQITGA